MLTWISQITRASMPHASWPTLTSYHRTRSNTPVYRLPDDILLDILLLDLGLTFTFEWYERLGQLMLVCSRWQALSIAPSPWAHVSAAQTLSIVKNSLCKSRDALLDVVYVSFALNYRSLRLDINEICDLLTNIHRWRYFEFWQWDISGFTEAAGAFINRLRHLIAPNLNSISLKSPILASIEEPFTPEITQLRHISVHIASSHVIRISLLDLKRCAYPSREIRDLRWISSSTCFALHLSRLHSPYKAWTFMALS
ncbi:hypothetical protein FRB95_002646 [Tulasnella sp. JGI-2019a]|nr:hypothetical protein FRB95_002646 [Tulasnella sp. JGI-2019a]